MLINSTDILLTYTDVFTDVVTNPRKIHISVHSNRINKIMSNYNKWQEFFLVSSGLQIWSLHCQTQRNKQNKEIHFTHNISNVTYGLFSFCFKYLLSSNYKDHLILHVAALKVKYINSYILFKK